MTSAAGSPGRIETLSLGQVLAGLAILLAVLLGALGVLGGPWHASVLGSMALTALCLWLAIRFLATRDSRLLGLAIVLVAVQLGLFVQRLLQAVPPFPLPLLQVAIVLSACAALLTVLLAGIRLVRPINAALMSLSVALALLLTEASLQLFSGPSYDAPVPEWVGPMEPHPLLGMFYGPHTELATYYPDNPRGYFEPENPRSSSWHLRLQSGSRATLEFPPEAPEVVRVNITKTSPDTLWLVQLEQRHLRVERPANYLVRFRARALEPRPITVALSQAHPPWANLGLYREVRLTREWQSFEENFAATGADRDARIHFDLAGNQIPVELSGVSLVGAPDGPVISPAPAPQRYLVRYDFNSMGCRGRDYPLSRAEGTTRILALGDSFTLGVGVHERDTFSAQLERELALQDSAKAPQPGRRFEVINCGVSGYGTKEERLFFEIFGAQYHPDIVLLAVVLDDDMSWLERARKGYTARQPGKLELLSHLIHELQEYRHRHPYEYSKCVEEILRLDREVRQQGARLVVMSFGSNRKPSKDALTRTLMAGLAGTQIPVLDVAKTLRAKPREALMVHPLDEHPNELAHHLVAAELMGFLREAGWLRE